jgi:hypothetical protein
MKVNFEGRERSYVSVDELVAKLHVEVRLSDDQLRLIQNLERRGEVIYVGINPYTAEIEGRRSLIVERTRDKLVDRQNRMREEI